jgi:hypothetical protein
VLESNTAGVFLFLCLVLIGYSIYRSQRRLKTILFAVGAMAIWLGLAFIEAFLFPVYASALGTLFGSTVFAVGTLTAWIHSRQLPKQ